MCSFGSLFDKEITQAKERLSFMRLAAMLKFPMTGVQLPHLDLKGGFHCSIIFSICMVHRTELLQKKRHAYQLRIGVCYELKRSIVLAQSAISGHPQCFIENYHAGCPSECGRCRNKSHWQHMRISHSSWVSYGAVTYLFFLTRFVMYQHVFITKQTRSRAHWNLLSLLGDGLRLVFVMDLPCIDNRHYCGGTFFI